MTRETIGRILCFALGVLYAAGALPLFTFGPTGKYLWTLIEAQVTALAASIGVAPWIATTLIGLFAIGGPLALVWLIAGKQVARVRWLLAGVVACGAYWLIA